MAIKIDVDNSSIIQLGKELKRIRELSEEVNDPKQLEEYTKDIEVLNKKLAEQASQYDVNGKSLTTLRKEAKVFQEITASIDPASDSMENFAKAAGAAGDAINATNERIEVFKSGTDFEVMGKQLGNIKDALLSLDFEKANENAKGFAKTTKAMFSTGGIKGFINGIKQLGSTFINLGKALITNPLFLLATVIALIVVEIMNMIKASGLLEPVMKTVGKAIEALLYPIKLVIDALKKLSDWFGLSSHAAKEAAEANAKYSASLALEQERATTFAIDEIDRKIKAIRRNGKTEEENFEAIRELEKEKLQLTIDTLKANERAAADELALLYERRRNGEKIDDEEISAAAEKTQALRDQLTFRLRDLADFDEETEYLREQNAKKAAAADAAAAEAAAKAAADAAKAAAEARRNALREQEDITISLIEDQFERERKQTQAKYRRQLEDLERNTQLKDKAVRASLEAAIKAAEAADLARIEEEQNKKREAERKRFQDALARLNEEANQKELKTLEDRQKRELELLEEKRQAERDAILEQFKDKEEQLALLAALEQKYAAQTIALQKKHADETKAAQQQAALDQLYIAANSHGATMEQRLAFLEAERLQELSQEDLTEREIFEINKKYADATKALYEEVKASKRELAMQTLEAFKANFDAIASLSDAILANEEANLKEGSKEAEEAAKKRFEINKAFQIGQAVINTAVAVTSALANPPGPPFSIPQAVAAGISGAAQVAAIAATKYKGGGGGKVASVSGPATTSSAPAATPSFNLFGSNNNQNNIPASSNINGPSQDTSVVKAIVVESDITGVQKKINRIETLSEL